MTRDWTVLASIKRQLTSFHLPFLQLHFFPHPSLPPSPSPPFPCRPGCSGALVAAVAAVGRAVTRETETMRSSVTQIIPRNWTHRLANKHHDLSCDLNTLGMYISMCGCNKTKQIKSLNHWGFLYPNPCNAGETLRRTLKRVQVWQQVGLDRFLFLWPFLLPSLQQDEPSAGLVAL